MSVNSVERVLWEFGENPGLMEQFRSSPDQYLSPYQLSEQERDALLNNDLKTLASLGVSTLLTMMIWPIINGPEGMPFAYLDHMNGK